LVFFASQQGGRRDPARARAEDQIDELRGKDVTTVPAASGRATRRRWPTPAALVAVLLLLLVSAGPALAIEDTWTARSADAKGAAELVGGGKGITVAVLDSWIDNRHPDFRGHVLTGATCRDGNCQPGGTDVPDSCEAHGTHVAGLIGSSRFGIAPEARILPVRVLTERNGACQAQAGDVASGIRFAASHGAQVINISLGSTYALSDQQRVIPQAVADAGRQGIVVVVAAGNGKTAGVDVYGNDALVVAATGPDDHLASYTQRGTGVDLAAPGGQPEGNGCTPEDCVVSTWSDRSYAADAGTSMAAPIVAGAAALLLEQRPDRGQEDVVNTLKRTARPLEGAGAGRVDVLLALKGRTPDVTGATDAGGAPVPGGGAAGAANADNPSVARVLRPDGSPESTAPGTTLADAQKPDVNRVLLWTAVALVGLVIVALVVVTRTSGGAPALAGGGYDGPGPGEYDEPGPGEYVDPETGDLVDAQTGDIVDPETGDHIDPETGEYIDPDTGEYIDPDTGEVLDDGGYDDGAYEGTRAEHRR
jgi:subtilisin family serine protease